MRIICIVGGCIGLVQSLIFPLELVAQPATDLTLRKELQFQGGARTEGEKHVQENLEYYSKVEAEQKAIAEKRVQENLRRLFRLDVEKRDDQHADEVARRLGFASAKQAADAKVDAALPVFRVRLDQLRQYRPDHPGADPMALLIPTRTFIYPILVQEEGTMKVRSSAKVVTPSQQSTETLQVKTLSSPELVQLLMDKRDEILKQHPSEKSCVCFVIRVPALNDRYFVGDRTGKVFMIMVIEDDPLGFKAGQLIPATKLFAALAKEARAKNYKTPR
jgi:hypothetical protein